MWKDYIYVIDLNNYENDIVFNKNQSILFTIEIIPDSYQNLILDKNDYIEILKEELKRKDEFVKKGLKSNKLS